MPVPTPKYKIVNGNKVPEKPLPVTLLSGFLGSGKTTLLQNILQSDHGLRIAVVVNDIGAINVDASLIKGTHRLTRTEETVVALQNGCICCTLRGDLLEELVKLAELYAFDYIIIESSGISEPQQVAETFDSKLADQMRMAIEENEALDEDTKKILDKVAAAGGLETYARLDTAVTVIDAFTMLNDFDTEELLSNRRDDVVPEDERSVSHLMVDQIEFADVIILNKMDKIEDPSTLNRLRTRVKMLNHRAKLIETSRGKVNVREIVNTGIFNLEEAQTGFGWLQDLHEMTVREVNGKKVVTPKPETEEYNIRNFIYSRYRPFHPRRLYELVSDKFILQLEHLDEEEDEDELDEDAEMEDADARGDDGDDEWMDEEEDDQAALNVPIPPSSKDVLANKRGDPLFARLFRSKGEFFFATRPEQAGEWSQAGGILQLTGGRPWFCVVDPSEYLTGEDDLDAMVKHDIAKGGEWGDRRQELVFIGENLNIEKLTQVLDRCLLTDDEYEQWQSVMRNGVMSAERRKRELATLFEDGFPDWSEEDHEGHDHAANANSRRVSQ